LHLTRREAKDIDAIIGLLDPEATAIADSGGLAVAFLAPIEGSQQVARAWIEIANRVPGNMTFLERTVNGQPGLVAEQDGITVTVFAFDVAGDRIRHIWAVRIPRPAAALVRMHELPASYPLPVQLRGDLQVRGTDLDFHDLD
jgi:hypothetical protein